MGLLPTSYPPGGAGHLAHSDQIADKLNDLPNVMRDYGATGDNSASDFSAFETMLDELPEGGVATVPMPPTNYLFTGTQTLEVAKRVALIGLGGCVPLRKTGTGHLLVLGEGLVGTQKQGLHLANLSLATENGAGDALRLQAIHRSLFENIHVPSCGAAGMRLLGSLLSSFVNCVVSTNLPYTAGVRKAPTYGVSLENGENGGGPSGSNANTFLGFNGEGITTGVGYGINLDDADGCLFVGGTSEGNVIGVRWGTGVHDNALVAVYMESNSGGNETGTRGDNGVFMCNGLNSGLGSNAYLADGTGALPSLGFLSDPDTGMYRHGTNEVGLAAGGQRRLSVNTVSADFYVDPRPGTTASYDLGSGPLRWRTMYGSLSTGIDLGGLKIFGGPGSPEGVTTAPVGSMYMRSDGGAGTSHYVKESGAGNTGWVAK